MDSLPLISAVIPAYNPESFLLETVASVERQTWPNWEAVVVDDGTDRPESLDILAAIEQRGDPRIRVVRQENRGLAGARNTGFREARGEAETFFTKAQQRSLKKIAIVGEGDLAEIIQLVAQAYTFDIHLISKDSDFKNYDALFIADLHDPQTIYDRAVDVLTVQRVFALEVLHIKR